MHEITLICEKRDYQTAQDIEEVEKFCKKVVTIQRKKQWSLINILKTGFSMNPFLIVGHTSEEMKQCIKDELVREKYDLIHVETFYVYQNLPKVQFRLFWLSIMSNIWFIKDMQSWQIHSSNCSFA